MLRHDLLIKNEPKQASEAFFIKYFIFRLFEAVRLSDSDTPILCSINFSLISIFSCCTFFPEKKNLIWFVTFFFLTGIVCTISTFCSLIAPTKLTAWKQLLTSKYAQFHKAVIFFETSQCLSSLFLSLSPGHPLWTHKKKIP